VPPRPPEATGFAVISTRWVGERPLAWRRRHRRLRTDDEVWKTGRAASLSLASIRLLTLRLTCVTS